MKKVTKYFAIISALAVSAIALSSCASKPDPTPTCQHCPVGQISK